MVQGSGNIGTRKGEIGYEDETKQMKGRAMKRIRMVMEEAAEGGRLE